jgi:hypothetical protein
MTPGLQFYAEQIDPVYPSTGLYPTMSTYGYGFDLEGGPQRNELYVVCKDGSIKSVHEPSRPIGWELIEGEFDDWYYRVTQMNHPRKRCAVRYHSRVEDPPAGTGRIGSVVQVCRRIVDEPQKAEITEQKDTGDEVDSKLAKIATIDPLLAQAAAYLNDPVQTDAMAKFAEGEMSYAEMRGLCG